MNGITDELIHFAKANLLSPEESAAPPRFQYHDCSSRLLAARPARQSRSDDGTCASVAHNRSIDRPDAGASCSGADIGRTQDGDLIFGRSAEVHVAEFDGAQLDLRPDHWRLRTMRLPQSLARYQKCTLIQPS
jgi:hypothetical protein